MATPGKLRRLGDDPVAVIADAVNRTGDQRVAAEQLGISATTVNQRLKRAGYRMRRIWVKDGSSKRDTAELVKLVVEETR